MGLISELKENDKKGLFTSNDTFVNYSTGILPLDYANGFWLDVKNKDGEKYSQPITGVIGGTFVSVIGVTGSGKAVPDSSMIPVPGGIKRLDSLNIGDMVFNRYGKSVPITGIYPQGEKDVYELTFTDGRKTKCCIDHLWPIIDSSGNIEVLPLSDILFRFTTVKMTDPSYSLYVPPCPQLEYIGSELPNDACLFGAMIGKKISNIDILMNVAYSDIRIPDIYKYSDIKNRRKLLYGILTNGIVNGDDEIVYKTSYSLLKDDIIEVVRSLGHLCYISISGHDANGVIYTLTIPKIISNKKENLRLINIEKLGVESQRCIMVDDPDHIYITEGYIPTHNTTLADQIGYNMIKDFKDGLLDHIDAERTALKHRMIQVMGANIEDERIILTKTKTSIEDTLDKINRICEVKNNGGDLYKYDVHNRTYNGKTFRHYIPTVLIIDSLPSFNTKEFNVEDLGTNMDAARGAKDVSRFYNNALDRMQEFNITIFTINHIRTKIDANPYAQPPPGIMLLKNTENLPRGYYSRDLSSSREFI